MIGFGQLQKMRSLLKELKSDHKSISCSRIKKAGVMVVKNPKKITSFLYNSVLLTSCSKYFGFLAPFFRLLWNSLSPRPVRTRIHGKKVLINHNYTYPYTARRNPEFNNPLVELVHQSFLALKRPVSVVDVGAAVGDTVLLLDANCGSEVGTYYAIEGDSEFYGYLENNLRGMKKVILHHAFLSSQEGVESSLVRIHGGTASAQGEEKTKAVPLDRLLISSGPEHIDILKTDLDGFDGKVLLGAKKILERYKPAVIFEWHPVLCEKTGNDYLLPFELLKEQGYQKFVFFTKFGTFSHFMLGWDKDAMDLLKRFCERSLVCPDWHYDVVALRPDSMVDSVQLAETVFARSKKSCY